MLKLIIADDEEFLRETISSIIDWQAYDIKIIGLCKNGAEVYDMVLDELPDIILTDIRMPIVDGLELIKKVRSINSRIQFIILSGYDEFEYAKTAMKYGVKHYLLKPCNEQQIIDSIQECKKEFQFLDTMQSLHKQQFIMQENLLNNVMASILNDYIFQNKSYTEILDNYDSYLDFSFTPWDLTYIYYLEFQELDDFLNDFRQSFEAYKLQTVIYGVYVKNTLLIFFKRSNKIEKIVANLITRFESSKKNTQCLIQSHHFTNLSSLLSSVLDKLKRFSILYYINNFHPNYMCNYSGIITQMQVLIENYRPSIHCETTLVQQIKEFIHVIDDIKFLKQLASNILIKIVSQHSVYLNPELTDWLLEIEGESDGELLKEKIIKKIEESIIKTQQQSQVSAMTQQICDYVEHHLDNPDLTLKYITENILFMNADYVSKKFQKEMGQKFSLYLTQMRIKKAKELINRKSDYPINMIAEEVGCGNNPRYFSSLFKKQTGLTPSDYIAMINHTT